MVSVEVVCTFSHPGSGLGLGLGSGLGSGLVSDLDIGLGLSSGFGFRFSRFGMKVCAPSPNRASPASSATRAPGIGCTV